MLEVGLGIGPKPGLERELGPDFRNAWAQQYLLLRIHDG